MKKAIGAKPRFEFVLLINNKNIICQRFFDINGYKDNTPYDLKGLSDNLTGMRNEMGRLGIIPKFLQKNSLDYLWETYNPHKQQKEEDIYVQNIFEKLDDFQLAIKVDGKTIVISEFSGNYFPPKVRYQVNIKDMIPEIISEIRDKLSTPEFNSWGRENTKAKADSARK